MKLQQCLAPEIKLYLGEKFDFPDGRKLEYYYTQPKKGGRCFEKIIRKRKRSGFITEWYEFVEVE